MPNITANEFKALQAIDDSEYGSELQDQVWSFTIAQNSDLNPRSVPGVVSSLVKKGLVVVSESGTDDANVGMTDLGVAAYLAKNGGTSKKSRRGEVLLASGVSSPFHI